MQDLTKQSVLCLTGALLFVERNSYSAAAFVGKPFVALLSKVDATALIVKSAVEDGEDGNRNSLNFPPLLPLTETEGELCRYGISPRKARVTTPLRALLSMPIVLSAGSSSANAFENAVSTYFPGARKTSNLLEAAIDTLNSSICPDEVNTKPGSQSLSTTLQDTILKQNGIFSLGGLAGLPSVGISGMKAFLSHCLNEGQVVIFFGPHVGISDKGLVGKVERIGRKELSGACGEAFGAYKAIKVENVDKAQKDTIKAEEKTLRDAISTVESANPSTTAVNARMRIINNLKDLLVELAQESDILEQENAALKKQIASVGGDTIDYQEEYIIKKLRPLLADASLTDENKAVAYITSSVYGMIFEMMKEQLKECWKDPKFWTNIQEITLLGGVLINRGLSNQDYFQPLKFETLSKKGRMIQRVDLRESAFGELPA